MAKYSIDVIHEYYMSIDYTKMHHLIFIMTIPNPNTIFYMSSTFTLIW